LKIIDFLLHHYNQFQLILTLDRFSQSLKLDEHQLISVRQQLPAPENLTLIPQEIIKMIVKGLVEIKLDFMMLLRNHAAHPVTEMRLEKRENGSNEV
jgi:hypothetical protein